MRLIELLFEGLDLLRQRLLFHSLDYIRSGIELTLKFLVGKGKGLYIFLELAVQHIHFHNLLMLVLYSSLQEANPLLKKLTRFF